METYEKQFKDLSNDSIESIRRYGLPNWPGLLLTKETDKEITHDGNGYRTCRESFIECMNKTILTQKDYLTDKLRFAVLLNDKSAAKIDQCLKILSLYEDLAKFLPTEIYKIKIHRDSKMFPVAGNNFFYVIASRRWFKSSYMLSLYLLLFRVGVRSLGFEDKDFVSINEFEKKVKSLTLKRDNDILSDYETCNSTLRNWQKLLRNYNVLFGKKTIVKNWTPREWGMDRILGEAGFRYEGISRLSSGVSQNEALKTKFSTLN